ncbi:MAG: nucleotidyltransferase family protein [Pseudomonadota bacterium]
MIQSVLILAGRRPGTDPLLSEYGDLPSKALIEVGGQTMLSRVVGTLKKALPEASLHVSGLAQEHLSSGIGSTPNSKGPAAAVLAARDQLTFPVLVTTADHALLSEETVAEFVSKATHQPSDVSVGMADRTIVDARFPEVQRTYLKFSDRSVTGCNLFYLRNERALELVRYWQRLEAHRKKPLTLARLIGIGVLVTYLLGRLSTDGLFAHVSKKASVEVRPVFLSSGEAAVDVDKPSDLALVNAVLEGAA